MRLCFKRNTHVIDGNFYKILQFLNTLLCFEYDPSKLWFSSAEQLWTCASSTAWNDNYFCRSDWHSGRLLCGFLPKTATKSKVFHNHQKEPTNRENQRVFQFCVVRRQASGRISDKGEVLPFYQFWGLNPFHWPQIQKKTVCTILQCSLWTNPVSFLRCCSKISWRQAIVMAITLWFQSASL